MPDEQLPDLKAYLGQAGEAWSDEVLSGALVTERSAQAARCRIPVDPEIEGETFVYPAELDEALFRRVARNLAIRGLPLGVQASISEAAVAVTRIGDDAEIRRLEAPYRKRVVG